MLRVLVVVVSVALCCVHGVMCMFLLVVLMVVCVCSWSS